MALVFAPLLSFDARGQIGKAVVFSIWKGKNYARRYIIPQNPNTVNQQKIRFCFAGGPDQWHNTLTSAQRAQWNLSASLPSGMSGFNWHQGEYVDAMWAGTTPPLVPP